jgi:hypothetical protein
VDFRLRSGRGGVVNEGGAMPAFEEVWRAGSGSAIDRDA